MNTQEMSDPRAALKKLSGALRKLHKTLVDLETGRFGPVGSPFEHLQLLTGHPQFAWLRRISEIVVELDERLDDKEDIDTAAIVAYKTVVERLLSPPESDDDFYRKYVEALQESTEAAIAHGELRQVLSLLAAPSDPASGRQA
ncbi:MULTISPECIES: hypothetical protein [Sodalis]|jgi:hypothetical protein|uniref:Uncharacterized protein n=1 Tax=Sodalis ligni TaxID=2697027 RepID=A0A4R1NFH5_9GAMM|nr:hypothetical protein [Sodalis ligni]TCL02860.1 hypothetical protein EZJ58_0898 [Sodalis ligni]